MRLIDADSLKEGIKELKRSPWYNNDINPSWQQGIKDAVHVVETLCIDEEPTVDAVPVRHGKWIDEGQPDDFFPHNAWRCSECGEQVLEIGEPWYNFCPACGARMDKE